MSSSRQVIDVMIVGAQKAGTSSLAAYLAQHPAIETHSQLELNYFIREEEYKLGYDTIYENYFQSNLSPQKILLGKSAVLMYFQAAMHRLSVYNPDCKIIMILRNPVSRAYSAYWYMRRVGYETAKTFSEALELEPLRQTKEDLGSAGCLYRDRGIYHHRIQSFYECFGIQNVYVLLLEDFKSDPNSKLTDIFEFIGVDTSHEIDTSIVSNQAMMAKSELLSQALVSNSKLKTMLKSIFPRHYLSALRLYLKQLNERPIEIPKMNPDIKNELIEFYRPHNAELEKLLGRKLDLWNR